MSRRLRVLHVGKFYAPYKGGMETHLRTLCERLVSHVDVDVVVANTARSRAREVVDGVPVTRLGTFVNLGAAPFTPGLSRYIRSAGADIVHLHWPHPTAVLSYLRGGGRSRLVITYHSDIVRQRALGTLFRPILHAALTRSSAIICTSPNYISTSPVLQRHTDRCVVLPFGIDVARLTEPAGEEVAAVREKYGPRIVLAIGRLVGYKGFEYLVRAMQNVSARLVLIGNGPLRASLARLAVECGTAEKIAFLPQVHDIAPYLHAADVFVLPSIARSEAFGLVQLEAMAAGIPVVNTDLPSGVPYVSPHGVSGLTVPPADPTALAVAVQTLLDNAALRRRYGAAGRARVRSHFNVDRMSAETLDLYDVVMRGDPVQPLAPTRAPRR